MKIFVSSTIKDLGDLRYELYRRLKELGHTPWLSEMSDFPSNLHPDSMTNCIMVAEECDIFVVILDKHAGLSYHKEDTAYSYLSGLKISEAEYRCARKKGKPVCIFIRKRAECESAIYRQVKDDEKQKESIKWYSENAVYEFYERLMHEDPHIPWRYTFDSINEIIEPLNAIIGESFPIEYIQENPDFLLDRFRKLINEKHIYPPSKKALIELNEEFFSMNYNDISNEQMKNVKRKFDERFSMNVKIKSMKRDTTEIDNLFNQMKTSLDIILDKSVNESKIEKPMIEGRIRESVVLQPNLYGVGIDLKKLIRKK